MIEYQPQKEISSECPNSRAGVERTEWTLEPACSALLLPGLMASAGDPGK